MIERGGGAGFQHETIKSGGFGRELWRQELQGDATAESSILGLVNYTHAAAAQTAQNAVMRYCLADHF